MSNLFLYRMHKEIIRCVDYSMSVCVSFSILNIMQESIQEQIMATRFFLPVALMSRYYLLKSGNCIDEKYK